MFSELTRNSSRRRSESVNVRCTLTSSENAPGPLNVTAFDCAPPGLISLTAMAPGALMRFAGIETVSVEELMKVACSSVAPNIPNESFAALVKKCAVGTLRLCNHSKTPGSVGFPGVPLIQKAIRSAIDIIAGDYVIASFKETENGSHSSHT